MKRFGMWLKESIGTSLFNFIFTFLVRILIAMKNNGYKHEEKSNTFVLTFIVQLTLQTLDGAF